MKVSDILNEIKIAKGTNEKKRLLEVHKENSLLRTAIKYGLDPFTPFNVVKVPKVKDRKPVKEETETWLGFFEILQSLTSRSVTGNAAIDLVHSYFKTVSREDEVWMRKILKKHLSIGVSIKSVNKVWPNFIKTFDVSLAQKFDMKRIANRLDIVVEPKLDGIRCFTIVEDGDVKMYARSGKLIKNFENTIAPELLKMGNGCYDGELMGQDFIALMRQAYRKDDVDATGTYLSLFDYVPLEEWKTRKSEMTCVHRFEKLSTLIENNDVDLARVRPIKRESVVADYSEIKRLHDAYVREGYEGAMVKMGEAPYKFGRGWEVMKLKAFHDVDLPILQLLEGTGKNSGKLGSVVVSFNGVNVQVGSGFSDELRDSIWGDKESFIGRVIEIRYQEVTPDGSLRFPTFVCFRNDR
jgi:ATP-dependent DNA ligase